jgi:hypothetical protein
MRDYCGAWRLVVKTRQALFLEGGSFPREPTNVALIGFLASHFDPSRHLEASLPVAELQGAAIYKSPTNKNGGL